MAARFRNNYDIRMREYEANRARASAAKSDVARAAGKAAVGVGVGTAGLIGLRNGTGIVADAAREIPAAAGEGFGRGAAEFGGGAGEGVGDFFRYGGTGAGAGAGGLGQGLGQGLNALAPWIVLGFIGYVLLKRLK